MHLRACKISKSPGGGPPAGGGDTSLQYWLLARRTYAPATYDFPPATFLQIENPVNYF